MYILYVPQKPWNPNGRGEDKGSGGHGRGGHADEQGSCTLESHAQLERIHDVLATYPSSQVAVPIQLGRMLMNLCLPTDTFSMWQATISSKRNRIRVSKSFACGAKCWESASKNSRQLRARFSVRNSVSLPLGFGFSSSAIRPQIRPHTIKSRQRLNEAGRSSSQFMPQKQNEATEWIRVVQLGAAPCVSGQHD